MKFGIYINESQAEQLEYEVLSEEFYIYLTRLAIKWSEKPETSEERLHRKNTLVNLSRTIRGKSIYALESDDWGMYQPAEYVWHDGHLMLIFRTLTTIQFIEFVSDLISKSIFRLDDINNALEREGATFRFKIQKSKISIVVLGIEEIEEKSKVNEHVNIRVLVGRMESAINREDYSGVLHASASIFETMAKDIIGTENIKDQTLKSFFDRFRKDSSLPKEILDYVLMVYDKRNTTPLAGHGSVDSPSISQKEAIILAELTKSFIRIEYQLKRSNL